MILCSMNWKLKNYTYKDYGRNVLSRNIFAIQLINKHYEGNEGFLKKYIQVYKKYTNAYDVFEIFEKFFVLIGQKWALTLANVARVKIKMLILGIKQSRNKAKILYKIRTTMSCLERCKSAKVMQTNTIVNTYSISVEVDSGRRSTGRQRCEVDIH